LRSSGPDGPRFLIATGSCISRHRATGFKFCGRARSRYRHTLPDQIHGGHARRDGRRDCRNGRKLFCAACPGSDRCETERLKTGKGSPKLSVANQPTSGDPHAGFGLPGQIIRNGPAASRLLDAKTAAIEAARRRDAVGRRRRAMADGLSAEQAAIPRWSGWIATAKPRETRDLREYWNAGDEDGIDAYRT
jgi:hypothetical protein